MVRAESHEAAAKLFEGQPQYAIFPGESVKIMELARRMVELSGMRVRDEAQPDGDIEIAITGLRPGEKLYEELLIGDNPTPTVHARIMKAQEAGLEWSELENRLATLHQAALAGDVQGIKAVLRASVQGYNDGPVGA